MSRSHRLLLRLSIALGCFAIPACAKAQPSQLSVTFFDVGQGDAALLVSPTGKRVLIDGGPPESAHRLLAELRRQAIDRLDLIILTHPHLDHLGGLAQVVDAMPVGTFLDSGFSHPSPAYTHLLETLARRHVTVRQASAGRAIDLGGGATLTLLGPPQPFLSGTRSDANANSVVARLAFRKATALFVGDIEPETEHWLLAHSATLTADVLKVAHHGGHYSSTSEFLQAVKPRIAVISVGARNDYGHPTPQAIARLTAIGAAVYRTDRDGTVTLSTDGSRWTWKTNRAAPLLASAPFAPQHFAPVVSAPTTDLHYLASRRSPVFHNADCVNARTIKPDNLMAFPTRGAALATDRRPAACCHP